MHRSKLAVLLSPSLLSLVTSLTVAASLMFISGFSNQAGKGSIYNYIFGQGSSAELISSSRSTLDALNNTILGNSLLNKVLYFAFWMLIGLIVYIILYAVMRGTGAAAEDLKESGYVNTSKLELLQNFTLKFTVRLVALFSLIVFMIIFIKMLLPLSALEAHMAASNILSPVGLLYCLSGFVVLVLSLHLEIVLVRFMFLRVRLFSQQEVTN